MSSGDFWDNREIAQQVIAQVSSLRAVLEPFKKMQARVEDFATLAELLEDEGPDIEMLAEAAINWQSLVKDLDRLELVSFLSGKLDRNNVFFSIHAGAGGTESCDWANMLLRMYNHWFENRGFKSEIIDIQPGEEAGIKSATMLVSGEFAYGYCKCERGVHRLVRISPFDSNKRRHTSFVAVETVAEIADDIEIEVAEADLRIDTYRASGAGGQHVNTTDSAIRITHIPTGIVVTCQNERSQHKNRATAMKMMRARLYEREEEKRRQEQQVNTGIKTENAWGNQIRSYVLQPYQMIKDLRTDVETSNINAVLDGELDMFVEAYLRQIKPGKANP